MPKLRFNYYTKLSWTPVANEVRDIQGTLWELCNNLSKLFIRKYSGFVAEEYCKVLEEFSPLPFLKETSYGRTSCPKNDESDLYYEEIMNKYRQFSWISWKAPSWPTWWTVATIPQTIAPLFARVPRGQIPDTTIWFT